MRTVSAGLGPRPQMVRAIERIREEGLRVAALTNNWATDNDVPTRSGLHDMLPFDIVVESAVEGLRKPDPRIYELVLTRVEVEPKAAVFLDDLGINLKPARAMGMTTIKVGDPDVALRELADTLGFEVH
jgi:epoxide hydrolase-like predicted phosphatase